MEATTDRPLVDADFEKIRQGIADGSVIAPSLGRKVMEYIDAMRERIEHLEEVAIESALEIWGHHECSSQIKIHDESYDCDCDQIRFQRAVRGQE